MVRLFFFSIGCFFSSVHTFSCHRQYTEKSVPHQNYWDTHFPRIFALCECGRRHEIDETSFFLSAMLSYPYRCIPRTYIASRIKTPSHDTRKQHNLQQSGFQKPLTPCSTSYITYTPQKDSAQDCYPKERRGVSEAKCHTSKSGNEKKISLAVCHY